MSLPHNTKPFRFCNECPALYQNIQGSWLCRVFRVLKFKHKSIGDGNMIQEPVRHPECRSKPATAQDMLKLMEPNND